MLIYSKLTREVMWLLVNDMHTIISVTLFFNFRDNSRALLTITSLVENNKLDMWSSKILHNKKDSGYSLLGLTWKSAQRRICLNHVVKNPACQFCDLVCRVYQSVNDVSVCYLQFSETKKYHSAFQTTYDQSDKSIEFSSKYVLLDQYS